MDANRRKALAGSYVATGEHPVRHVAIVVYPGFQVLNAAGPMEMWRGASDQLRQLGWWRGRHDAYECWMVAAADSPVPSSAGLDVMPRTTFEAFEAPIDTLVVAGGMVENALADPRLIEFVRSAAARAKRVVALGAATFILAKAGLLDGRRATTHWRHCAQLAAEYPSITVERDLVYVKDGAIYTCAGITAALDLALAIVQEDYGRDLALAVARDKVMFFKRPGSEPQISTQLAAQSAEHARLADTLRWVLESPAEALSVEAIAERMAMSPRNLARLFRSELQTSPAKFIERARMEMARRLLDESDLRIETIAVKSGFGSEERLRRAFQRAYGLSPKEYQARNAEATPVTAAGNTTEQSMQTILVRLRARLAEINEELRSYPQPIARCDAQLGGLIEERAEIRAALERAVPVER